MHFSPGRRAGAIAAALALCTAAQANTYTLVDLGAGRYPTGINKRGDIAGAMGVGTAERALVYHAQGHGQGGWVKLRPHGKLAFTTAISDRRDVAGAVDYVPAVWAAAKGPPMTITMPGDFIEGFANGIQSFDEPGEWQGIVVGNYAATDGRNHCFRSDGLVVKDVFPGQGDDCNAAAVNSRHVVVGGANREPGGPTLAFEWHGSSLAYLGALASGNPPSAFAEAINARGAVVGWSATADSYHAVLWRDGQITDIGASEDFPGGTVAYAINRDGSAIVGTGNDAADQPHALRFDASGVIPLDAEVERLGGWILQRAFDVNDDGVIIGDGLLDGQVHGFMLVPAGGP